MSSQPATSNTPSPTTMPVSLRTHSPPFAPELISLLDNVSQENNDVAPNAECPSPPRPMRIYTRPQLLSLSQSPMVKPPPDMPDLRTWFGIENENLINKKDEPPAPNSARDRRFRRDADEGDAPSRPTFRSALQPSQMGNFKHQSLRDRDRDSEKERDKDGHERLRHLSDKFDRDRLLPLSGSRNKDREPAPHVNPSTTRGQPAPPPNGISRRADARESAKKKVGEANEDWRRGGEIPRSADRPENGRRDREDRHKDKDRERARSRHRDSSRSKRETSSSRKDRDRDEDDDGRHWRDDGKRDERMAARRERERTRAQERESDDRRWPPGEDRDGGRYKRNTGRERKIDDVKEDRQKEREPAWMDTYIPSESTSGILGGQDPEGKLDGIQAWKKDLKERDTRDKEVSTSFSKTTTEPTSSTSNVSENRLDEIQIFRMLMKKEEDKKRLEENGKATSVANEVVFLSNNEDDRIRQRDASTDELAPNFPSVRSKPSLTSLSSSVSVRTSPIPPSNLKDPAVLTSVKVNQDDCVIGPARASPIAEFTAAKTPSEHAGAAFPPVGSRVLAMKNKTVANVNPASNVQSLNGSQNSMPESHQIFSKNEPLRPHGAFSPFDDPNRPSYILDDARDLSPSANHGSAPQRLPVDQLFPSNTNSQTEANFNGSLSKGSRLAKIFENKSRDMPTVTSKAPPQTGYISPPSNQTQRQEMNNLGANPVHSVEELMAMLNNSSQRNNLGSRSNPHLNNNFNNGVPGLLPLQQQQVLQQQQPPTNRLEHLYESRTEDRSFVPDGMVPGLRTAAPPPPRRESLGHFNDPLDESLPYNLQRLTQQPQVRGLEQLFNNPVTPLFNQQIGRPGSGVPLQPLQPNQFRGGSSPALNASSAAQRLPPGLANLGGRPPHDPSQYLGQHNLPSLGPQHGIHSSNPLSQHQLPFNGYNVSNSVGLNNGPSRLPGQNNLLQNSASPQFNLGHHSLDPRLSNHHHLMGIGGSGITGNRITGGFPLQQAPNAPNHVSLRPQQQQQQLLPHQLMPHHMQQGHPSSNTTQSHDLMAVLMGAHRE